MNNITLHLIIFKLNFTKTSTFGWVSTESAIFNIQSFQFYIPSQLMNLNITKRVRKYYRKDSRVSLHRLRGENLNYNSCTNLLLRKSQNLLFLAPEVQWALKVYRVCSIHVSFKFFEPCPYLVCHVTTIKNV